MARSKIFLSGWEYNPLLSNNPLAPRSSGLPAQVLWDGTAQFWLFEKVLCSKESLDGDMAASQALGWSTGDIFDNLRVRGFLKPVTLSEEVSRLPELEKDLKATWLQLKTDYDKQILRLLENGRDDKLEEIKLGLLSPLLKRLNCLQNISPNSIRHWTLDTVADRPTSPVSRGLAAIAQPVASARWPIRAGFTLCRPPGTGVPLASRLKQKRVEQQIEKPMIPRLLAGLLSQEEYHDELKPNNLVYKPISAQLSGDYERNIDRLERLRNAAERHLWKDLHGEWLPRLEEDPAFLPEFKNLIRYALARAAFDPYLGWITDLAIMGVNVGIKAGVDLSLAAAGVGPAVASDVGSAAGAAAGVILKGVEKTKRDASNGLTVFYQKSRKLLRSTKHKK